MIRGKSRPRSKGASPLQVEQVATVSLTNPVTEHGSWSRKLVYDETVSVVTYSGVREVKKGFHTACKAGIEGLIWKDFRATFGTRLAEAGCDAFTIAQLLGHSDVRVTMRYVRSVEETKRVAVEAIKLSSRKSVHKLATDEIRPPVPAAANT